MSSFPKKPMSNNASDEKKEVHYFRQLFAEYTCDTGFIRLEYQVNKYNLTLEAFSITVNDQFKTQDKMSNIWLLYKQPAHALAAVQALTSFIEGKSPSIMFAGSEGKQLFGIMTKTGAKASDAKYTLVCEKMGDTEDETNDFTLGFGMSHSSSNYGVSLVDFEKDSQESFSIDTTEMIVETLLNFFQTYVDHRLGKSFKPNPPRQLSSNTTNAKKLFTKPNESSSDDSNEEPAKTSRFSNKSSGVSSILNRHKETASDEFSDE
jgi:hypothetical protein